jgi:hypothetical protein
MHFDSPGCALPPPPPHGFGDFRKCWGGLGVMENNEETRQKRLARQKRLTKATPVYKQQQRLLVRERRILCIRADSQIEGAR